MKGVNKGLAILAGAAFLSIVAILTIIGVALYESDRARERTNQFRKHRSELVARTDRLICQKVNDSHDILADLINSIITAQQTEAGQERTAALFADALQRLRPRNCDSLPTAEPFNG